MSKSEISYNVDLLKAMDNFVREVIGDEDIIDYWMTYGVPDGASYDDLEEIASDSEMVSSIIRAFNRTVALED